jgi:hypothetical protein
MRGSIRRTAPSTSRSTFLSIVPAPIEFTVNQISKDKIVGYLRKRAENQSSTRTSLTVGLHQLYQKIFESQISGANRNISITARVWSETGFLCLRCEELVNAIAN